jgi:hypothetical protein
MSQQKKGRRNHRKAEESIENRIKMHKEAF